MTLIVDVSFPKSSKSRRVVLQNGDQLLVGRANEQVLLSTDPRLSRRHFQLQLKDGIIKIKHLSKTNPTLVAPAQSRDFQPVRGLQALHESCRVIAGAHRFVLTLENAETLQHESLPHSAAIQSWCDLDDDSRPTGEPEPEKSRVDSSQDSQRRAPFRFDDSIDEREVRREQQAAQPQPSPLFDSVEIERPPTVPADVDQSTSQRPHAGQESPPSKDSGGAFVDFDDASMEPSGNNTDVPADRSSPDRGKSDVPRKSDQEESTGFPKKMVFPIADNFFDD